MVYEMASLHKNEVWDMVELSVRRNPISSKWVFKKKTNAEGKVEKYKARLEVKEQMDVKTTFLHGELEEEIYTKQREGYVVKGKKELVCKLKKSLYGLKQSPRMWYQKFDRFIWGLGFSRSKEYYCVYFILIGDRVIYLVLYVDDMLLVGNDKEIIHDLKTQFSSKFDMKDIGATSYILDMEIKRDQAKMKLWLNQRRYFETILQRFNMQDSKPVKVPIPVGVRLSVEQCSKTQEEEEDMSRVPYACAVGGLMYAMVCARLDIAYAVGILSKFMSKPGKEHWTTLKRVCRYLRGTSDYGLCYQGRNGLDKMLGIHGFVDAD
eukprot:PITA_22871